jgi:hypothetical protein
MNFKLTTIALAAAAAMALPATAGATTVKRVPAPSGGMQIVYSASHGQDNDVAVLPSGGGDGVVVYEASHVLKAGRGCLKLDAHAVYCSAIHVKRILVNVGDGQNSVRSELPKMSTVLRSTGGNLRFAQA